MKRIASIAAGRGPLKLIPAVLPESADSCSFSRYVETASSEELKEGGP